MMLRALRLRLFNYLHCTTKLSWLDSRGIKTKKWFVCRATDAWDMTLMVKSQVGYETEGESRSNSASLMSSEEHQYRV